jgi:opacity protein-like surface antigen
MRNFLLGMAFLLALIAAFYLGKNCRKGCEKEIVTVIDTVTVTEIEHDTCYVSRLDTVYLHSADTLHTTDTVRVVVPISTYHFKEKGLYDITASGYHLTIDSISVFPKTTYKYIQDNRRWAVGLQAGVGVSKDGFFPYFGVGISYNLFRF